MPLTLSVGVSKKMGLPDYGSLGATCGVEVELDATMLQHDLEAFHRHVHNAYVACAQAVNDELARNRAAMAARPGGNHRQDGGASTDAPSAGNGETVSSEEAAGQNNHRASARQLDFAGALARQIRGLGIRRLEAVCQSLFEKPLAELSGPDASRLIDTLKGVRSGQIALATLLDGDGS